jgi:hypothetical protein
MRNFAEILFLVGCISSLAGCSSANDPSQSAALFDKAMDELGSSDKDGCPALQMDKLHIDHADAVKRCTCMTNYLKATLTPEQKADMMDLTVNVQANTVSADQSARVASSVERAKAQAVARCNGFAF